MAERLYLIHYSRGDDICPLCQAALTWRKIGARKYTPCDKRPVLCIWDFDSSLRVVHKGEIISGVRIVSAENAEQFAGKPVFYAFEPHVFTCSGVKRRTAFKQYEAYRRAKS